LEDYGLSPECSGDLVPVEAEKLAEAVAQRPVRRTVVNRGRVVACDGVTVS
jgi:cytosine deaminase